MKKLVTNKETRVEIKAMLVNVLLNNSDRYKVVIHELTPYLTNELFELSANNLHWYERQLK